MNFKPQRFAFAASLLLIAMTGLLPAAVPDVPPATVSASGQFAITTLPQVSMFYRAPDTGTNRDFIRLQAPWLAVSAERFKSMVWRSLGVSASSPWSGKIFLYLHPARTLNDSVVIAPQPFINVWNCRLDLPDVIDRDRYARAISAAVLLELANRKASPDGRSAELPAWLVDGMARRVASSEEAQAILSAPTKTLDGLTQSRVDERRRGIDPLADARQVLQNYRALTFDQLSWPDNSQMTGADGGVYLSSAQLFVDSLLNLKNGPEKLRNLLSALPACENWQSAFYRAFADNFRSPLDVEKWWALRVVAFAARDPGPRWTVPVSRQKLTQLLAIPVDVRYASNSLPQRTEISLQAAIQNFSGTERDDILRARMRDLQLAQLRLAVPLAVLADGYRQALADFLGERSNVGKVTAQDKHAVTRRARSSVSTTLKKLNSLDTRRREVENGLEKRTLPASVTDRST